VGSQQFVEVLASPAGAKTDDTKARDYAPAGLPFSTPFSPHVTFNQVATAAAMVTAAMAAADPSPFVSWDDFVRIRNKQDEHLRDEFTEVRQQFEQVDARFARQS
jgi:hypothetical protein